MALHRWDPDADGPLTEQAMRRKMTARGFVVTRVHYPAGVVFPPHTHGEDKLDGVLAGRFRLTLGGEVFELGPGDMVDVPAGVEHAAAVVGTAVVVSLDGVRWG